MMANGDQPPAPAPQQQLPESGGPSAGDQILHILKAVGYGLGNMVGEVRAGRERQAAMLTNMAYHNPSLLDEPHGAEFRSAFKKTTGLSDEGIAALRAHGRIKGLLEELAGQAGVPLTEPDYGAVSPYDRAVIARQATTEAPVSEETLGVVRGNLPQVQRAPAAVMGEIQERLPSGVKLTGRIDPKTGQPIPTLAIGKTGVIARLKDQTQLMSEFFDETNHYKAQVGRELTVSEIQNFAQQKMADAARRGLAAPDDLKKLGSTSMRAMTAAEVQRQMFEAQRNVMFNWQRAIEAEKGAGGRGIPPEQYPGMPPRGAGEAPPTPPPAGGAPPTAPPAAPAAAPPARGAAASQAISGTIADYKAELAKEVAAGTMTENQMAERLTGAAKAGMPPGDLSAVPQLPPGTPPAPGSPAPGPQTGADVFRQYDVQKKYEQARVTNQAKYEARRDVSIGEGDETVLYPPESPRAGTAFARSTKLGDALDQGGVIISKDAAKNFHTLEQANEFFHSWPAAAEVLFAPGGTAGQPRRSATLAFAQWTLGKPVEGFGRATIANQVANGKLPLMPGEKNTAQGQERTVNAYMTAVATMQEIRNNLIIMLRSGMGERGNFAKSIVDHALRSGPSLWDDKVVSNARMQFLGKMLAASKLSQGIPLTQEDQRVFGAIDKQAMESGARSDPILKTFLAESPKFRAVYDSIPTQQAAAAPSPRQQLEQMLEHYAPRPAAQ